MRIFPKKFRNAFCTVLVFLFFFSSSGIAVFAEEMEVNLDAIDVEASSDIDTDVNSESVNFEDLEASDSQERSVLPEEESLEDAENPESIVQDSITYPYLEETEPLKSNVEIKANEMTGALTMRYPLIVPPGRNGMQPDLSLTYNSQDSDQGSIFGYGWSLDIPYIKRENKLGVNNLYNEIFFSSSISGELVRTSGNSFGAKIENGDFLEYKYIHNKDQWEAVDKNGIIYKFGLNFNSRQGDPAYKWYIDEITDTNGNIIDYRYINVDGQVYPHKIFYTNNEILGNGIFQISFSHELRPDEYVSYGPGFKVDTKYRVNRIEVKVGDDIVRRYDLGYEMGENGNRSVLIGIFRKGWQEGTRDTFAGMYEEFQYRESGVMDGWQLDSGYRLPVDLHSPCSDDDNGIRIVDVNGDGFMDILRSRDGCEEEHNGVYLNKGYSGRWTKSPDYEIPIFFTNSSRIHDTGARIADINGDAFPDLLLSTYDPDKDHRVKKVYINNTDDTGWTLDSNYNIPIEFIRTNSKGNFHDYGVRIADMNGDGLADIFREGDENSIDNGVYMNKGDGTGWEKVFGGSTYDLPRGKTFQEADSNVRLANINNDGLIDLLFYDTDDEELRAYLNTGEDWQHVNSFAFPHRFDRSNGEDQGVRIADVNGDGLDDLMHGHYEISEVYINKGHGLAWERDHTFEGISVNLARSDSGSSALADVNGDSMIDLLYTNRWGHNDVWINDGDLPDLLEKTINGREGITEVVYQPTTQYIYANHLLNPDLPFVLHTVKKITRHNGFTWSTGFHSIETTEYEYNGGEYYYDDELDRKFAGFSFIEKTDSAGNVRNIYYHQGNGGGDECEYADHPSKIGKVYREDILDATWDNDRPMKTFCYKWKSENISDDRFFVNLSLMYEQDNNKHTESIYKAEGYSYDDNGNLTRKVQFGEVDATNGYEEIIDIGEDRFITNIQFAVDNAGMIRGLPSKKVIIDQDGNKIKESKYYYDNKTFGIVDKGNMTKQEDWVSGDNYISIEKSYNPYGLVVEELEPRGKMTSYTYDSYNLYPIEVINPKGQITKYSYDYSGGKISEIVDANDAVTEIEYDGFDRIYRKYFSSKVTDRYDYTDSFPSKHWHTIYPNNSKDYTEIVSYYDGFGRVVQQRKRADDSEEYSVKDYLYDERGLLKSETLPYFSHERELTNRNQSAYLNIKYFYDALDRTTKVSNYVGEVESDWDPWRVSVTDEEGNEKYYSYDAYENLERATEYKSIDELYQTYYENDLFGNVTKITDEEDNIKNLIYDGLGRLLSVEDMHDPNDQYFGTHYYIYDEAGNLKKRIDAERQVVNYTYDDLNRVLTEDYLGTPGIEVTYSYDDCHNGKGRLCIVTADDISTAYTYTKKGGIRDELRRIEGVDYRTQYKYDLQGNITNITYPDGSKLEYIYDLVMKLKSIKWMGREIIKEIDYEATEAPNKYIYGNGLIGINNYDKRELYRLKRKIVGDDVGGNLIQDINYEYDLVGNVKKIVDSSPFSLSKNAIFKYDDLYRLIEVNATNTGNGEDYENFYRYSPIGNFRFKSGQGVYSYEGNQGTSYASPYAVTSIGEKTFEYDKNGNLISDGERTFVWDYNGRLTSVENIGEVVEFAYDAGGERVVKRENGKNSFYPNKYFEVRGQEIVRHVYVGDERVASVRTDFGADGGEIEGMKEDFAEAVGEEADWTTEVFYHHNDHLTGTAIETDENGNVVEVADYFPFGEMRINEQFGNYENEYKFTGKEWDEGAGVYYYGARYYDSAIGRFLSKDPWDGNLEDPQSLNKYSYVRNNPVRLIDPSGETFAERMHGFAVGIGETGWETIKGTYNAIMNCRQTAEAFVENSKRNIQFLSSYATDDSKNFFEDLSEGTSTITNNAIENFNDMSEYEKGKTIGNVAGGLMEAAVVKKVGEGVMSGTLRETTLGAEKGVEIGKYNIRADRYPGAGGGGINVRDTSISSKPAKQRIFGVDLHRISFPSKDSKHFLPHIHWGKNDIGGHIPWDSIKRVIYK